MRRDQLLAGRGSGLVDLLVARRRVLGAHLYGSAVVLELEVVGLGAILKDPDLVLGVTGVRDALHARALVRVVARAGDVERLVNVSALGSRSKSWPIPEPLSKSKSSPSKPSSSSPKKKNPSSSKKRPSSPKKKPLSSKRSSRFSKRSSRS